MKLITKLLSLVFSLAVISSLLILSPVKSIAMEENSKVIKHFKVTSYDSSARIEIPCIENAIKYEIYMSTIKNKSLDILKKDDTKNCILSSDKYLSYVYAVNGDNDFLDKKILMEPDITYYFYLVINDQLRDTFKIKTLDTRTYWCKYYDIKWYGDGSADEFYISTPEQLAGLSFLNNGSNIPAGSITSKMKVKHIDAIDFSGKIIHLTSSIDMTDYLWIPIGKTTRPFKGIFDGGNYDAFGDYINSNVITGLHINNPKADNQGLFGYLENSTIKNLIVKDGYIKGDDHVGGVVGRNDKGSVINCSNTSLIKGNNFIGGIVGCNEGNVSSCNNNGTIKGSSNISGIVGRNKGSVSLCQNNGDVVGSYRVGGIVGSNIKGSVADNLNTGLVYTSEFTEICEFTEFNKFVEFMANIANTVGDNEDGEVRNNKNTSFLNRDSYNALSGSNNYSINCDTNSVTNSHSVSEIK